ncbi:hypothetical protein DBY21_08920 [Candidatus Gastranaerophilales bacterium]|nr:MAG: hypothetical protein DBY21_08920 [Candidatus Gastranaerophilales bacterium]
MSKYFNYKEFANQLRFQVRGVIPEKYKENEVYIRDMVYQMSLIAAKALYEEDDIEENNCQCITQIIAEWTFHKTIDLISCNIPKEYHEPVLHKINYEIYQLLVKFDDASKSEVLNKAEKLVNKTYKKTMLKLYEKKCIDKPTYTKTFSQSNIDEMMPYYPISIWDILKVHPFITLAYIFALPVTLITSLLSFYADRMLVGIPSLALFSLFLFRFLTRKSLIATIHPKYLQ